LWFINNRKLERKVLGVLAKYQEKYEVTIYGFVLMGNHYHLLAKFPKVNRALFMRDFNSAVARLVGRYVGEHGRRSVWARRYSYQVLPRKEDVFHWFYYAALNPVSSGIVRGVDDYPSYNSFSDASRGIAIKYQWIDWSKYLMQRRYSPNLKPEDFTQEYTLQYSRLPGYEDLDQVTYEGLLKRELYQRQSKLVEERLHEKKGFLGLSKLRKQETGAKPLSTKTSTRHSFRPLVLTLCSETKRWFLQIYFGIKELFLKASAGFRAGNLTVDFPKGTYPPPRLAAF
jgi:REP element-mobilizing transposase RayT